MTNGSNGNGDARGKWLTVALLILSWIVTTAVQWGAFNARISAVEEASKQKVDRNEYEAGQRDLRERLDRIESKLDRNLSRSGGH
jgi:hypothetical protein